MALPYPTKSRTWDLGTSANGSFFDTEFNQLYANDEYLLTLQWPVGSKLDHFGGTAPTGFLACDGSAVSRSTYAALFAVIGTTYGAGNGTTTFNLPDARGLVAVGAGAHGTMTRADASAYNGGSVGATRDDQRQGGILKITDSIDGYGTAASGSINNAGGNRGFLITSGPDGRVEARVHATDGVNGTPRTGNETRPAEIAVLVCIKY